jgi:hypothetical protein
LIIIFDEKKYAEETIRQGLSENYRKKDLFILSKYYRFMGYNDADIKEHLIAICKRNDPEFNEVVHRKLLHAAIEISKSQKLKLPIFIDITNSEMNMIRSQENDTLEKLMFVLLVIAKYNKSCSKSTYEKFYVTLDIQDIFTLAKISGLGNNEKHGFFAELNKRNLIYTTFNNYYEIKFVNQESESVLNFKVDDDLIYQFERFIGKHIINCECCGKLIKPNSNRQKVCKKCFSVLKKIQTKNRVKKYRDVTH